LAICSKIFARLQGNSNAYLGYLFLAPAILPVCMLSCYRGYFQGLLVMQPTALTQIIEQVFKLIFGLLFVQAFLPNIPLAVGGATLGITLSDIVSLNSSLTLVTSSTSSFVLLRIS
jgi:stage V sporulation protein B